MMPKNGYKSDWVRQSLDSALGVLGDSSKQTMMFYMTKHYGITFDGSKKHSVGEIEDALKGILGPGYAIVAERMHFELAKISTD
jgi:hypothetical protein